MTDHEFVEHVIATSDNLLEASLLLRDISESMDFRSTVQDLAERFADKMMELNHEADKLCYEATEFEYTSSEDEDD